MDISSKLGFLQLKGKRRRVDTILYKENEGIGISRLKILTEFTKIKRTTQGQRNMRMYFSSRGVIVRISRWRRNISSIENQKLEGWRILKSQKPTEVGNYYACLHGLYRIKINSN